MRIRMCLLTACLWLPMAEAAEVCRPAASDPASTVAYERSHRYRASDSDSKITSRRAAMAEVSALLLAEIGVHVLQVFESRQYANGVHYARDDIQQMAAGKASIQVLEEHWDGQFFDLRACLKVDPQEVQKSLQEQVEARQVSEAQQQQLQTQQQQIARLQADMMRLQQLVASPAPVVATPAHITPAKPAVAAPRPALVMPAIAATASAAPSASGAAVDEATMIGGVLPVLREGAEAPAPAAARLVMPALVTAAGPAAASVSLATPAGGYPLLIHNRSRQPFHLILRSPGNSRPHISRVLQPGQQLPVLDDRKRTLAVTGEWTVEIGLTRKPVPLAAVAEWSDQRTRWELDTDMLEVVLQP